MTVIRITHSITCDSLDGRPWPPADGAVLWAMVRRTDGLTLWRSIELVQSDPPPADAHPFLGGMQQKGHCNGN
jgi:hypothetical protein